MITVWGRATSSNVQIVMWALAELGFEVERIDAGGTSAALDTPEYQGDEPERARAGAARPATRRSWESAAIVRYLGARYGN